MKRLLLLSILAAVGCKEKQQLPIIQLRNIGDTIEIITVKEQIYFNNTDKRIWKHGDTLTIYPSHSQSSKVILNGSNGNVISVEQIDGDFIQGDKTINK